MPNWIPTNRLYADSIDDEINKIMSIKDTQKQNELDTITSFNQLPQSQVKNTTWQPMTTWKSPTITPIVTPVVNQVKPTTNTIPIVQAKVKSISPPKEEDNQLDPLHPFKVDKDLPLWMKAIRYTMMPFDAVQEYLFDPLLAVIHSPFTNKKLVGKDLETAKQEGIASFFPGGVRHKTYEDLKYVGKWAVEMLPWLIVPPVGAVGAVGEGAAAGARVGAKGIAGAVGKLGKTGVAVGRALEYSPAGLVEKVGGAVVGAVTGKANQVVQKVSTANIKNPTVAKFVTVIDDALKLSPEQAAKTHEFRIEQITKAQEGLRSDSGMNALTKYMQGLSGTGEKVDFAAVSSKFSKNELDELAQMIAGSEKIAGFDIAKATSGFFKTLNGKLPFDSELEQMQKVFGNEFALAIINKKPVNRFNQATDILNIFRSTLATGDLSYFRQGAVLVGKRPQDIPGSLKASFKAMFSEKNAVDIDTVFRSGEWASKIDRMTGAKGAKFYWSPATTIEMITSPLTKREESFMSNAIYKIPILGKMMKGTNRGFATGLNYLKSRNLETTAPVFEKLGAKEADYDGLVRLINAAAGRGDLPAVLNRASPIVNAVLFSPRLAASRLQLPSMILSGTPMVRKEAAKTLVQFMGAGSALVSLAALGGAKVETNPKSADFGKMKIGNTRLDIWGGYAQWARFLTQLSTGERKTSGGNIVDTNRSEVAARFLQSKLAPGTSLLWDILRGESYAGEEVNLDTANIERQAWNRIVPLFAQDLLDAIDQEGLVGGATALPGFLGVGVTTYIDPAQKRREQLAKEKYGKTWEEIGLDPNLGQAAQKDLERSDSKLLALIAQNQEDYNKTITGKSDINNLYRNQTMAIENKYKGDIDLAAEEFRDTGDGVTFREKVNQIASNRRAQYDVLDINPQFASITARYDEVPDPKDLKKMSPQDWARKEYMRLLYGKDMYDKYGNYRFDMVDSMKELFTQTFDQKMLDYVETYQGIKDADLPDEYKELKVAQKILRPYWEVENDVLKQMGQPTTEWKAQKIASIVSKIKKRMKQGDPLMAKYYDMFYGKQV